MILLYSSCNERENLDFPKSIGEIEKVILSRPDKESNGKFADHKELNEQEIIKLLEAISESKPKGLTKFYPDYFIYFKTKKGSTKKIKVNGNTIKGYKSDFSYEFNPPIFLSEF